MSTATQSDQIPLGQKLAFSMGVVSDHYANVCLAWIFITPFFVDIIGLSASTVGLALASARCWDAFTDPLVGKISDSCRSRYGRRRPFILVGAVLTGLLFPIIWMVSDQWSSSMQTMYLFVVLILFFSVYSIFSVPYEALGSELTFDYDERNKIFVVRKYVQEFFNLGIVWVFPFAAWLGTRPSVNGTYGGIRLVSWLIGFVIISGGILPALFNKEKYREIAAGEGSQTMKQTFWAVRGNKPLLIVVGVIGTYLFSIMATANLAYFVNVYYIYEGDVVKGAQLGGWDGSIRFFFALGAAALIHRLTGRIDKHRIMTFSVYILIIAFVGTYFTIQPGRPWLSLVMKPLIAVGECGFWVLILSMRADVCDWDEYLHRSRNEGVIAAVTNWCNKIAITLAIAVSGFILQHVIQFDSSLSEAEMVLVTEKAERDFNSIPSERISDDGKRPESLEKLVERYKRKEIMDSLPEGTLERLRFFYSIPQVIALLICVVLLRHYPLNHEKMSTIRSELESRRGS